MSLRDELYKLFNESDPGAAFGLDWGTYSSQVAVLENGAPPRLCGYTGDNRGGIPSLFYRDKTGAEFCGAKAKAPGRDDPANLCRSVKMRLSEDRILLSGRAYPPAEIAEKLVRDILKTSAESFELDFIDFDPKAADMVCGVPVRFNAAERGQVREIIQNASGAKSIRLVSEPILAALAYDYFLNSSDDRPVLCFDCGAGTFDVCVLKKTPQGETPYTVCDGLDGLRTAGDRLDDLMAELILKKLSETEKNRSLVRALSDPSSPDGRNFREWQSREMKEALSENDSYTMPVTSLDGRKSSKVTVRRTEYEEKIRPVIGEMTELSASVLKAAGLGAHPDIRILLVGGSCRIPLIKAMLAERFPWVGGRDICLRNPEQMVALGAAIYARLPQAPVAAKVPFGYAVETHSSERNRDVLAVEIPSDAVLPFRISSFYSTLHDRQSSVRFNLYEVGHGESRELLELDEGRKMGGEYWISHSFGREVPKGTSVRLETELNTDGILTMSVEDMNGKVTRKTFTIVNSAL